MPFTIHETPTGSATGSRDNDNKITRGIERNFTLDASDASLTKLDARLALASDQGVFEGASYPGSQFYVCKSVNLNQVGPISYEATASYETTPFDEEENPDADPDINRATISYSSVSADIATDVDASGSPLVNRNNYELYQGLTRTVTDALITIKKQYSTFSPAAFYAYENHVNDDTFMGFPAGTVLVKKISPQEIREKNRVYWDVTVELQVRQPLASDVTYEKAWWNRVRNEGYYCWWQNTEEAGPDNWYYVRCLDAAGQPASQPMPLDDDGVQLPFPKSGIPEAATFLYFEQYTPINFGLMNLGVT